MATEFQSRPHRWRALCFSTRVHFRPKFSPASNRKKRRAGFTLVETIIACGMICIFVVGALLAMTQMNRYAAAARLRTLALAMAQQRIDDILTVPWQINAVRPTVLASGTATESNLKLNADAFNNQTGLGSAFTSLGVQVPAVRTTDIVVLDTFGGRRLRALVIVTYTYRNRTYDIRLNTMRTTDTV